MENKNPTKYLYVLEDYGLRYNIMKETEKSININLNRKINNFTFNIRKSLLRNDDVGSYYYVKHGDYRSTKYYIENELVLKEFQNLRTKLRFYNFTKALEKIESIDIMKKIIEVVNPILEEIKESKDE